MNYREAIAAATLESLERIPRALVLGCGVADPKGIFGTTKLAHDRFPERVIETPLSETMLTGALTGLSLEGWHPMLVHARSDFLTLSMEGLVNTAASWRMAHGSDYSLGLAVRCIVGRGWGQGPQHSKNLASLLLSVPNLRILMPYDSISARWAIREAFAAQRPTIIVEYRSLYEWGRNLPGKHVGQADALIIASGEMIRQAMIASELLHVCGVNVGIRSLAEWPLPPGFLDAPIGFGPMIIVESGWLTAGMGAEIIAQWHEAGWNGKARRIGWPGRFCPTNGEDAYYPGPKQIAQTVINALGKKAIMLPDPPSEPELVAVSGDRRKEPF